MRWLAIKGKPDSLKKAALEFGHIPLDRKSLHVVSETLGGIGLEGPFSMGHIHTKAAYDFYQQLAGVIVAQAGGTSLRISAHRGRRFRLIVDDISA